MTVLESDLEQMPACPARDGGALPPRASIWTFPHQDGVVLWAARREPNTRTAQTRPQADPDLLGRRFGIAAVGEVRSQVQPAMRELQRDAVLHHDRATTRLQLETASRGQRRARARPRADQHLLRCPRLDFPLGKLLAEVVREQKHLLQRRDWATRCNQVVTLARLGQVCL